MEVSVSPRDLFATRIWQFELNELATHFADWEQEIRTWRSQTPQPAGRSNRSGWNSEVTLFERPAFAPLRRAALQCFKHAMGDMKPTQNLRVELEAWVNMHDPGGYNTLHVHPHMLLSGCFYLTVPDGSGAIVFRDPRPGVVLTSFPGCSVNCANDVAITPQAGHLYIFPHWLEHRVEANGADEARIAIAMNARERK